LDTLTGIDPNDPAVKELKAFAATGVPSASALAHELTALLPKLEQAAGSPAQKGGVLDRLQANAEKLVRIRPASGQPGDTPAAILSRVEAHAANADIAGALTELKKLPPSVRAPAQSWMTKAENRRAAVEAGRHFAAAALAALGQPSSEQGAHPQ
jgi:hypothetical protein